MKLTLIPLARMFRLTLLALLTTACSLASDPPVTYVVVTSTPLPATASPFTATASLTPPPTATLAPTATPTPDIAPDAALKIADRALLDGYFEDAAATYQLVLNRGDAAPDQQAGAAFGMGQAALHAGLFQSAVDALTILITQYPQDYRAPLAYFLRGDAYLGLSNWTAAITDYQTYLSLRPGIIDSYAQERIGDAQLALGEFTPALASYTRATAATRTRQSGLALLEKVAQVYLASGDTSAAVARYDAILAEAENTPYRAEIEYLAAQALLDAGRLDEGLSRMQRIVNNYPETARAFQALSVLLENGRTQDSFRQGRVYYLNQSYQDAILAFNAYSSETPLGDIPAELYLLLGRAYREVGNAAAALVAFETIVTQYPTDPLLGEALLDQGRTRFLNGDNAGAIEFYLRIASDYGYLTDVASEALWRAGYLYGTTGQNALSRQTFIQLADKYPTTPQAVSGLNIAASQAVTAGDTANAELLFSRLAQMTTGPDQAAAYLQIGRLAQQRGDTVTAASALDQAVRAAPDSYYSARAADLRAGVAPFQPPVTLRFEFDEAQQIAAAEDWLRTRFNLDPALASPLWVMTPELEAVPPVVRGRELWLLGIYDAGQAEFFEALDLYTTDPLASYRLSVFMRGLGAYFPSMQGAANIITHANIGTLDAPSFIARLRYPVYYRDEVLKTADQYEFDPLLLFSLIRHESLFNTHATAAAGEKGLTQVIPDTAAYIAQELAWEDYQHSDLFRPYAGIAFGAFFINEQLDRFNGNVYAALAGYNAGPGRAINWLQLAGADPDAFMNVITIATTQTYIQRIYGYYNIYRALYGTG